jgi:hypothetical protein
MGRSSNVYVCYATTMCALSLTTGVKVTSESLKSTLLGSGGDPPLAFVLSPRQPAAATAFNITVLGTWSGIKSFAFALGGDRVCSNPLRTWNTSLGSAKVLNTSAVLLAVDAAAVSSAGFVALALCMRMQTTAEIGAWFTLAQVAGHSNHNVFVGTPSAVALHTTPNLTWAISGTSSPFYSDTRTYFAFDRTFDIVLTGGWVAARLFTIFAFDASLDFCNPNLTASFNATSVVPLNASHDTVRDVKVVNAPPQPGGGHVVLCGAVNATSP